MNHSSGDDFGDKFGNDGYRVSPDKTDVARAMKQNCGNNNDVKEAIRTLEASIAFRKQDLKRNCGDGNNERGRTHRRQIREEQDQLDYLKQCLGEDSDWFSKLF